MLDSARYQWEEGRRRLEAEGPGTPRYRQLAALTEVIEDELRRRVGQTFTLAELAQAYATAEDWVREAIVRATPARARAGVRDTALIQDAAFGQYARGASDYEP